jgi:hypothetical protein
MLHLIRIGFLGPWDDASEEQIGSLIPFEEDELSSIEWISV